MSYKDITETYMDGIIPQAKIVVWSLKELEDKRRRVLGATALLRPMEVRDATHKDVS